MQVATTDLRGTQFRLTAENASDRALIDALHGAAGSGPIGRIDFQTTPAGDGKGYVAHAITLLTSRNCAEALEAQAASQCLSALRQLFRLGLGQKAIDGHVGASATDPYPQHQLATVLEELQLVAQTISLAVGQHERLGQTVVGTHVASPSVGEAEIVAQQGAAK